MKIAACVPEPLDEAVLRAEDQLAHIGVQAVGADDQVEAAGGRALERHLDRGAAVVQGGDAVVEEVFGRRLGCVVKQFDQVVAQQLDVGIVDRAAGRRRFGVPGQLVAVAVDDGGAPDARSCVGSAASRSPMRSSTVSAGPRTSIA